MSRNSEFTYDPTKSGPAIPERSEKLTFQPNKSLKTAYTPDPTNLPDTYRVTEGPTFAEKAYQDVSENVEALSHAQKSSGTTRRQNRAIDASRQLQNVKIQNNAVAAERAAKEVHNTLRKGAYLNPNEDYVAGEKNDVYTPTYTQEEKDTLKTYRKEPGELSTAAKEKIGRRVKVEEAASTRFDKSPSKSTGEWATIPTKREIDLAFEGGHINKGERDLYYEDYHNAVNKLAEPRAKAKQKQVAEDAAAAEAAAAAARAPKQKTPEEAEYDAKVAMYIPPKFKPPTKEVNFKLSDWENDYNHKIKTRVARGKFKEEVLNPWLAERTAGMSPGEVAQFKSDRRAFSAAHTAKLKAERDASKPSKTEDDTIDPTFMPYVPERTREGYLVGTVNTDALKKIPTAYELDAALKDGHITEEEHSNLMGERKQDLSALQKAPITTKASQSDMLFPNMETFGKPEVPAVNVTDKLFDSDVQPGKIIGQTRIPKSQPKDTPTGEPVIAADATSPLYRTSVTFPTNRKTSEDPSRIVPIRNPKGREFENVNQPAAYKAKVNGKEFSYDNPDVGKPRVLRYVDPSMPNLNTVARKDILELDDEGQLRSVRIDEPAFNVTTARDYLQLPKKGESTQNPVSSTLPGEPIGTDLFGEPVHLPGKPRVANEEAYDTSGVLIPNRPLGPKAAFTHPGGAAGKVTEGTEETWDGRVLAPTVPAEERKKRYGTSRPTVGILNADDRVEKAPVTTEDAKRESERSARRKAAANSKALEHYQQSEVLLKAAAAHLGHNDVNMVTHEDLMKGGLPADQAKRVLENYHNPRNLEQAASNLLASKRVAEAETKTEIKGKELKAARKINWHQRNAENFKKVNLNYEHDPKTGRVTISDPMEVDDTGKPSVIYHGDIGGAIDFDWDAAQRGELASGGDAMAESLGNYRVMIDKIKQGVSDFSKEHLGRDTQIPLSSILSYGRKVGDLPESSNARLQQKSKSTRKPVTLTDYITALHNIVAINKGSRLVSPKETVQKTDTSGNPVYSSTGAAVTERVPGTPRTKRGQPTFTVERDPKTGKVTGKAKLETERYNPETGKYPTVKKAELEELPNQNRGLAANYALSELIAHHEREDALKSGQRELNKLDRQAEAAEFQKKSLEAMEAGEPAPERPKKRGEVTTISLLDAEKAKKAELNPISREETVSRFAAKKAAAKKQAEENQEQKSKLKAKRGAEKRAKKFSEDFAKEEAAKEAEKRAREKAPKSAAAKARPPRPKGNFKPTEEPNA